jgi:hypothetical protein
MLNPDFGDDVSLPNDRLLLEDLVSAHWSPRSNGIIIEPKEKIKERLGRSPDDGDAVVMSAANLKPSTLPEQPQQKSKFTQREGEYRSRFKNRY